MTSDNVETRRKATKARATVALIEEEEKPPTEFVEPSSGPVEKKVRKNARSKTSSLLTAISLPQHDVDNKRLISPEEYRRFVQGTPERHPHGLSAAFLDPIDPMAPPGYRGGHQDDVHGPPYGAYISTPLSTRQDGSSCDPSTFRRHGKSGFNSSKWNI